MYTVHHDAVMLPLTVSSAAQYGFGGDSVPAVSVSASRGQGGILHLTMSNLDPSRPQTVVAELRGAEVTGATGRVLTAPAINSHNSFERPDVVRPVPFAGARVAGGRLAVTLPPRSVVVLELR